MTNTFEQVKNFKRNVLEIEKEFNSNHEGYKYEIVTIRTIDSKVSGYRRVAEVPVGDTFTVSTKVILFNEERDVYQEMFCSIFRSKLVLTNEENVSEDEISDTIHKAINEAIDAKLEESKLVVTN